MKKEKSYFSNNVRHLRQQRGWTLTQLAQLAELETGYVNAVENNEANPTWVTLNRFASIFGVSLRALLFDNLDIPPLEQFFSNPSVVRPPKYHKDVGYDLVTTEDFVVPRWDYAEVVVPTAIYPPDGHFADITTRGSTDRLRFNIDGTVDPTFDGHVLIAVKNGYWRNQQVKAGTAIAQVRFLAYSNPHSANPALPKRGEKKRGSTGK